MFFFFSFNISNNIYLYITIYSRFKIVPVNNNYLSLDSIFYYIYLRINNHSRGINNTRNNELHNISDATIELHDDNSNLIFNLPLNISLIIFYGFRESSP